MKINKQHVIVTVIILFLSTILYASPKNNDQPFLFKLYMKNRESSKDSNSQTTLIDIMDSRLIYKWKYTGFHPGNNFKRNIAKHKTLKDNELDYIKNFINMNQLNHTTSENRPLLGPGTTITIDMEVVYNGKKSTIKIKGTTNHWTRNKKRTNLRNIYTVKKIKALASYIRSVVNK